MADCYNKIYLKSKDIEVACGKCLNCLENKKKEKALRLIHEMNNYKFKLFVTLTMDDLRASRNKDGLTEIRKRELNNYIKRLQYYELKYNGGDKKAPKLKYIACGEYGAKSGRAHYHLVILCNRFIHFQIKKNWNRGHVDIQALKDVRAVYYTAGYSDKKQENYFKDKYEAEKTDREVAFLKTSRGNGKDWIKEAIATKKITTKNYFIDSWNGKNKIPQYYKTKIKEAIMGVKPRYKKLSIEEREYRLKHFGDERKTIMLNQDTYDENYWKWEIYSNKLKEEAKKRDPIYYDKEAMVRYKDNWKEKLWNLMFNEKWDEMTNEEREFTKLFKERRELLKIKAEQKWFNKTIKRVAI